MNTTRRTGASAGAVLGLLGGLAILALLMVFVYVGWGIETGRFADTEVLSGNKLPPRVARTVAKSAHLRPNERILYFYSAAMTPEGDGNLLTNQRVISYVDDGADAWCDFTAIEDVVSVSIEKSESWLDDSTIVVTDSDGSELTLYASAENGGDDRFVDSIRSAAKLDAE